MQIFQQQATRNTVTGGAMAGMKTKQPPQILPKPPGSVCTTTKAPQPASSPQIAIPTQQQQTILLNHQMIPSGPMLVQQQTSSGVQLILRSPPPTTPVPTKQNTGTMVLSNGSLAQQGTVLVQSRHQPQPLVRLVPGQTLQLQQIQTSSGTALIAVPTPSTPTPPPQPPPSPTLIKKAKKKKKKEEEPTRLDLANLIKLSGIEDEDVAPVSVAQHTQTPPQRSPTPPPPPPATPPKQLVAQLQTTPSQCQNQGGLRVSVGEDGRMILHQNQPQVSAGVTPSIAAAAQSQLAQLLAHHGDSILQTAVLSWANTDSLVVKSGGVTPQVLVRRPTHTPTSVVVANPTLLDPNQNGVRIVTDINGLQQAQNRIQMVPSGATVSLSEQNRVQIVNSLSEQQNRVQILSNSLSEQQNRVQIVSNSLSEQQNRVQIVTSVPHSQSMSFNDQNRFHTIVSRAPSSSLSLEQQNRVHIVSSVPTSTTMSLTQQQNRVQIVSDSQMSTGMALTDQQSRVQIVSAVPSASALSLTEQQNRVQIVSGVPNSTLTEQQNRVQIVSGIPSSSSVALTEQNRIQIVSGVPNPPSMALSEQNRVQIVSAVPHSSAMSLEQQDRVQIVSGVHSSGAMSMTEQQNRLQIVSGINNKALSLTEQQNRVQIISSVPSANSVSLTEQQNRVQIVSGMQSSGMSLAEQQNRVHILSGLGNSSMCCEQNRVQIVSNVSNSAGIQINEQPTSRVHVVSASTNTTEQPSGVQIVSGIPNRTATSLSERIQLVQNDQSRVQIATSVPNLAFSDHQNRVHIVSANSNPVLSDQNRVQIVTGVPNTNIVSLSEQQSRVQIVSNTSHSSATLHPEQQRLQLVSSDPSVQIITTMANIDNCRVSNSHNEHQRLHVVTSLANSGGNNDQRVHIVSSASVNDRLKNTGASDPQRQMQSSGVQTHFQVKQPCRSPQFQPTVISPRCNPTVSPQSPRGGASKSPVVFPMHSPQHIQTTQTQKPTFSNRPNLTVVAQSSPSSYHPQPTLTSQPVPHLENHAVGNHYPQFSKSVSTCTSHQLESSNHPSVITSLASCQTTTAITKPLQAVTRQPQRPPTTTTTSSSSSSLQNSFLDSIAQSHPNIVINKSPPTPPIACKALKPKKLPKKSAVVKPMMHEERQGNQITVPSCEKDPEPPSLVPISSQCETTHTSSVVQRVQTIQLTPQKQQHLKAVQSQINVLSNKKLRTPAENAALQRLFLEQQKILFSGKLIPTIPGQHAQGITFQVSTPVRVLPTPVTSPRSCPPPPQPPPPPPPAPPPTVSKATSPIHVQVGTQTSCESSPSPPTTLSHAKRAALIDQQQRADRQGAVAPDVNTPFASTSDAVKRLVRYHCMDEPVFSESDLHKADEIFEATARHLLDKNAQMLSKYRYLLLMESMRQVQTSELIMLGRMFVSDETTRLEAAKIEVNTQVKREPEEKLTPVKRDPDEKDQRGHERKREREDVEDGVSVKKHCADDEEINAQVQNAIDSILNLGNNRSDPALDEAVRSILSS